MASASPIYCPNCGAANEPHAAFCFSCGTDLRTSTSSAPPSTQQTTSTAPTGLLPPAHTLNGHYRILQEIGQGGFGAVYKAADTQFGDRLVAVKEMSQSSLSTQEITEATEAFKREAFLLAGLTHPNLPSIYDYFAEGRRWYLVMSFIEGETLEDYLSKARGGQLPVEEVLQFGIQLCSVLGYLHNRQPPIIFRDLKPANIMRTPEGQFYLIDFGIARHFKQGKAKDTTALGSPGYAAPEQYGRAQTTPQADIYSLGATLHQLLSGNDPSQTLFSFAPLRLPTSPDLERLIMRMVDRNASKRPASMAEVKQELQRIATGRPPGLVERSFPWQSPPPTFMREPEPRYQEPVAPPFPPYPPQAYDPRAVQPQAQMQMPMYFQPPPRALPPKPGVSRRTLLVGLAGLVIGGGLASFLLARRAQDITSQPVSAIPTFDGSAPFPASLPPNALLGVAWSPDGKRIATASGTGIVQVLDVATKKPFLTYHGHTNPVSAVAWSPDGHRIASAAYDATVQIWDATTGEQIFTYTKHESPVLTVAWSPDGKRIASGDYNHKVRVWDATSGDEIAAYYHEDQVSTVAWSPNGRRLASGSADGKVQVTDATTWEQIFTYTGHSDTVETVAWSPDGKRISSASNDKTVQVWNAVDGSSVFIYRGHSDQVWAVAWAPDGRRIASGSWDRTVQVWSAVDGGNAHTSPTHASYVLSVAWSPDSRQVVSGDADGSWQVWKPE